jgi:hypothetical protein
MTLEEKRLAGGVEDLKKNQGFYIYRGERLIIWGTWFRISNKSELSKLARVKVDIPNSLDHLWEIDVKKSSASIPDKIKKRLIGIVDDSVTGSENIHKYKGKTKKKSEDYQPTWSRIEKSGSVNYTVNRGSLLYKHLVKTLDEDQLRVLSTYLKELENNFPFQDVYLDKSKGTIFDVEDSNLDEKLESLFLLIDSFIQVVSNRFEIRSFITSALKDESWDEEGILECVERRYKEYYE